VWRHQLLFLKLRHGRIIIIIYSFISVWIIKSCEKHENGENVGMEEFL